MISFLRSVWRYRCPKCRSGKSYLFTTPFNYRKPLDMPEACHICGQKYEPEPGFYYGAMFISYIVSSFLLLPLALILVFHLGWSDLEAMVVVVITGALLFFRILRMARSLWIHVVVKYDPPFLEKARSIGRDN